MSRRKYKYMSTAVRRRFESNPALKKFIPIYLAYFEKDMTEEERTELVENISDKEYQDVVHIYHTEKEKYGGRHGSDISKLLNNLLVFVGTTRTELNSKKILSGQGNLSVMNPHVVKRIMAPGYDKYDKKDSVIRYLLVGLSSNRDFKYVKDRFLNDNSDSRGLVGLLKKVLRYVLSNKIIKILKQIEPESKENFFNSIINRLVHLAFTKKDWENVGYPRQYIRNAITNMIFSEYRKYIRHNKRLSPFNENEPNVAMSEERDEGKTRSGSYNSVYKDPKVKRKIRRRLDKRARKILVLRSRGLKHEEISRKLALTLDQVKKSSQKVKKVCREVLNKAN